MDGPLSKRVTFGEGLSYAALAWDQWHTSDVCLSSSSLPLAIFFLLHPLTTFHEAKLGGGGEGKGGQPQFQLWRSWIQRNDINQILAITLYLRIQKIKL